MTEIDKIFKEVPPTSFFEPKPPLPKNLEEINQDLIQTLNLNLNETVKFKEGISLEKLNTSPILKMVLEILLNIIQNSEKIQIGDKNDDTMFLYNKKMIKDLCFGLFQALNNYSYNDRELKCFLMGKLIQSLNGR
jgi:hypothetical protein